MNWNTAFWVGLALGLVVGVCLEDAYYMLRRAWRELEDRKENRVEKKIVPPLAIEPSEEDKKATREASHRYIPSWVGWMLVGMAVITTAASVTSVMTWNRLHDFISCQATHDQAFEDAFLTRTDASSATAEALYQFLKRTAPVVSPVPPKEFQLEQFRAKLDAYIELYGSQKTQVRENPYPPLPEECGDPTEG